MHGPFQEQPRSLAGQSLRVLVWDHDLVDMWCLDGDGARVPYQGRGSRWHFHADLELTVITHGEGQLYVGDHIGRFAAPDCILLGKDVPHVWKSRDAMAGVSLQFHLGSTPGLGALSEFTQLERLWARARHGLRWEARTALELRDLLLGMEHQSALRRLARFITIVETMHERERDDARQLSRRVLTQEPSGRDGDAMNRVLDHIMDHYREELRLEGMVRMSGSSQATFCRRFARLTGKTFTSYVNAIRLHEVRRALLESERSVTDIAFAVGFNNLSHFHAVFRSAVGCTPLAFRRRSC